MDLSCKRNTEVEQEKEQEVEQEEEPTPVSMDTEFTSVEMAEADKKGNIINQQTNREETRMSENQDNLTIENESKEISSEDRSAEGDKSKTREEYLPGKTEDVATNEGDLESKENNDSNLDECEMTDSKDEVNLDECEMTDSKDEVNLDECEMTDSKDEVPNEKEGNDELECKFENVKNDPSESLRADEESKMQEKEEECVEKTDEVQEDNGSNVIEKVKDTTDEVITNADEENANEVVREEKIKQMKEEFEDEESMCMPSENLFEYQWPPDRMGEWYFVQEQISEYLGVTSFKRKYPDLERRVMDMKEKDFLRERGVVTEEQVTLGLTALKSEDVYDLMVKDYNKKYTDYLKVLQEKERQNISNKHKEYEAPIVDTGKVKEYTQRAVRQTADYNASLMRERREERQYFLDMQTMVVQVSKNKVKQTKKESTKVDGYPVALIPGQFQNFYRRYTPEELKYFPLQTALYGPVAVQDRRRLGRPGWEDEDEPVSDMSEPGSPEPASALPSTNVPPTAISMVQLETPQKDQQQLLLSQETYKMDSADRMNVFQPKEIDDAICGICLKDKTCNKFSLPEELIHCAQCDNSGHPSCLEMNDELVNVIKTYPWQCMECKTCFCCGQPTDEDKMMFCDDCDRGYHTFCVGLQEIPTGKWACPSCLAAQAKEKELAAAAEAAAAAAVVPNPEAVLASTPSATPPPSKRKRSAKKREL